MLLLLLMTRVLRIRTGMNLTHRWILGGIIVLHVLRNLRPRLPVHISSMLLMALRGGN